MASKILPLMLGGALALSVSGMAVAQNTKAASPDTDKSADSANKNQQPTGQQTAPAGRMAPSGTTGSGAKSGSSDLGANPKGNPAAEKPLKPLTDEGSNSANPKR
jgi:hypothetical protein